MTRTSTARGVVAPTRTTAPLVQHAEQLHLCCGRQLPDLVEEQRSAVRRHEVTGPRAVGAGERPLLVAEQLRLDQLGRQRAAIDRDEGALPTRARTMDGAGHQFLAVSRLSLQKNRDRTRRDPARTRDDALHHRAAVDDCLELGRCRRETGAQAFKLPVRLAEQIGEEIRRDVERYGSGAHAVVPRRLDQRRRKARLRQDDPDGRHGRCAGAKVEGKRGAAALGGERLLAGADGSRVDLSELRGTGEPIPQQVYLGLACTRIDPALIAERLVPVIGEQKRNVERAGIQSLGNRPDAGRRALFRRPQIRVTDPTDEDLAHHGSITICVTTQCFVSDGFLI